MIQPAAAARKWGAAGAFTIIELLVVVSIVALLASALLPALRRAREQARSTLCKSNGRQIAMANLTYGAEQRGRFCPGAANMIGNEDSAGNLHRWHGERDSIGEPFDSSRGPLVPYLGSDGRIRACPSFRGFEVGFENGAGGYGYNNAFVGVEVQPIGGGFYSVESDLTGAFVDRIRQPVDTVMFTDAAFVTSRLIEYSFAEPRFHPALGMRADPSIHFRHHKRANVTWCDGHVDDRPMTFTWSSGVFPTDPGAFDLGWFGYKDDNSLFDLE